MKRLYCTKLIRFAGREKTTALVPLEQEANSLYMSLFVSISIGTALWEFRCWSARVWFWHVRYIRHFRQFFNATRKYLLCAHTCTKRLIFDRWKCSCSVVWSKWIVFYSVFCVRARLQHQLLVDFIVLAFHSNTQLRCVWIPAQKTNTIIKNNKHMKKKKNVGRALLFFIVTFIRLTEMDKTKGQMYKYTCILFANIEVYFVANCASVSDTSSEF